MEMFSQSITLVQTVGWISLFMFYTYDYDALKVTLVIPCLGHQKFKLDTTYLMDFFLTYLHYFRMNLLCVKCFDSYQIDSLEVWYIHVL